MIAPGTYRTADGVRAVTPARVKHWHETLQGMLAAGIHPPVSWGHKDAAQPGGADAPVWRARFTAGKVAGSEIDPGTNELFFHLDVPGLDLAHDGKLVGRAQLPDGRPVQTAIDEVSIAARDWTDGTGRVWRDAPIHLALTPLPVVAGQGPFQADLGAGVDRFGLASLLDRFGPGEPPAGPGARPGGDGPEGADEPQETPGRTEPSGGGLVRKLIALLSGCGLQLPPDTTEENFLDRLYTAATVRRADSTGDPNDPQGGKPQMTTENAGLYMGTDMSAETTPGPDPRMAALLARVEADDRQKRLARVDALCRRGLPAHRAQKLREACGQARFALDGDGNPETPAVDEQLALLEDVLPKEGDFNRRFLGSVVAEPAPEEAQGKARHRAAADEFARNTGLPARNGS